MLPEIDRALRALDSRNPYERVTAIEILAKFRYVEGVDRVIAASYDPQRSVSEAAVWALGDIGSSIAIERLSALVKHAYHSYGLRWAAIHSMGMIGDVSTLPLLVQTYVDFDNGDLCEAAARSIQRFGHRATETLIELLNSRQDENDLVRQGAVRLLRLLKDDRSIPHLVNSILEDDPSIGWEAIHALGAISDPATVPFLVSLLEAQSYNYTPIILWALNEIGTHDALDAVIRWRENNPRYDFLPADLDDPFLPPTYPFE